MRRTLFMLSLLVIFSFFIACTTETPEASNEAPEASPAPAAVKPEAKGIQGVWSLDYMDVGVGENQRTRHDAQFMIYITKKHYSAIRDFTPKPEPGEESATPAPRSFMADAGTYDFTGTELIVHHMLAAFPAMGSMTFKCSMEGDDTLILEPQYDKMIIPGMENIKPSEDGKMGYGDAAMRYVFKRLE